MRISLPSKTGKVEKPNPLFGQLRDVFRYTSVEYEGENRWQIKITVPGLSMTDNLYLTLDDEEIEFLEKLIIDEREKWKKQK
jgi:hypothetical protein